LTITCVNCGNLVLNLVPLNREAHMLSRTLGLAVKHRLRYLAVALPIAIAANLIHEGTHYGTAWALGERVSAFLFLTAGFGTSQVIYETPVGLRAGAYWLVIAWLPSVVTTLIGYLLYFNRRRFGSSRRLALAVLYAGFIFLLLDPFYLSVLSIFMGGDIGAVHAIGWSPWPVRAVALVVFLVNWRLTLGWIRELRAGTVGTRGRSQSRAESV
jgi:hypothetical protein